VFGALIGSSFTFVVWPLLVVGVMSSLGLLAKAVYPHRSDLCSYSPECVEEVFYGVGLQRPARLCTIASARSIYSEVLEWSSPFQ
jgi:hypothetical protein